MKRTYVKKDAIEFIFVFTIIVLRYFRFYEIIGKIPFFSILSFIVVLMMIRVKSLNLDKEEMKKAFLLFGFFSILTFLSQKPDFIYIYLLSLIFINQENKKVMKFYLFSSLPLFLLTIIFSFTGILENKIILRYGIDGISYRSSLGFDNPNAVFMFWIPIVFSIYYLVEKKIIFFLITIIPTVFLFLHTDSRSGILTILILYIYVLLNSKIKKIVHKKFLPIFFCLSTFVMFILSYFYGGNYSNLFNKIFNLRPKCINFYLTNRENIRFFGGTQIEGFPLDNIGLSILIELGIISFIIFAIIFYKAAKKIEDDKILVLLFVYLIYGIAETSSLITGPTFIMIFVYKYLVKNKKNYIHKTEEG